MEHVLQVNILWVTFVAGSVIPLLTGLVVKARASSQVKSEVNLVLSAVAGACTVLIQASGRVTIQQLVIGVFTTLTASGVTYNHVWKPTGVADAVQGLAPEHGIGTVGTDPASSDVAPYVIPTAAGGTWTAPSTWIGGQVPGPEDNVAMGGTTVPPTPTTSQPAPENPPEAGASTINLLTSADAVQEAQEHADRSLLTGKRYLAIITPVVSNLDIDD